MLQERAFEPQSMLGQPWLSLPVKGTSPDRSSAPSVRRSHAATYASVSIR